MLSTRLPEHLMYKNRLQEYAQKSGLQLPVYQSSSKGFPHAPKFTATVCVNQTTYTSNQTFSNRKEAEQNVAKIALENIKQATKEKPSFSAIYEDPKCCKSILNEFAFKTNRARAKYKTFQQDKLHPVYLSSMIFDGTTYNGEVGKSKKEAEQLVARIAIESLLESDSGTLLQIINSKNKTNCSIDQSNTQKPGPSQQSINVSVQVLINASGNWRRTISNRNKSDVSRNRFAFLHYAPWHKMLPLQFPS